MPLVLAKLSTTSHINMRGQHFGPTQIPTTDTRISREIAMKVGQLKRRAPGTDGRVTKSSSPGAEDLQGSRHRDRPFENCHKDNLGEKEEGFRDRLSVPGQGFFEQRLVSAQRVFCAFATEEVGLSPV